MRVGGARPWHLAWSALLPVALACAESFSIVGQCRSNLPNGAYELHSIDGALRVSGAFAVGRKTGTFVYWAARGARIGVIPYDDDAKTGTVALWYVAADGRSETGRRLEAQYASNLRHGETRSWYPGGALRTDLRYDRGSLVRAQAWTEQGQPLTDTGASDMAARDWEMDEAFYATLASLVRDHAPRCEGP